MFTSKSERTFYDEAINKRMPDDAFEISVDVHAALMEGQAQGKVIEWGDDGHPVLTDPPEPSPEFFAVIERAWRNAQLSVSDGVVSRHRDEVEAGGTTSLTAEQYIELQAYRLALRNWPEAGEFPLAEHRPAAPLWLTGQLQ